MITSKLTNFMVFTSWVCTYIQKKMKKSQTQLQTPSHRLIFIADVRGFSENQMRAKPLGKLHFAVEAERNKNKRAKRILLKYKRSVLHTRFFLERVSTILLNFMKFFEIYFSGVFPYHSYGLWDWGVIHRVTQMEFGF